MRDKLEDKQFSELDSDPASGLQFLISHYQETGDAHLLFESRLMQKRLELGLPLIHMDALSSSAASADYEEAMIRIARETGEFALERGDITGAWRYFRAIGEPARVAAALERVPDDQGSDVLIDIAFQQAAHPAKGLAFILAQHGMCRAITAFGMYPVKNGRAECIALLVRKIHAEVLERIARTIESQEGSAPLSANLSDLIDSREWLFGEYDTYVDTSHLLSLLSYATEVADRSILEYFRQLCDYGTHLSPMFQSRGQAPFEDPFVDCSHYVQARLGIATEEHVLYFRNKVAQSDPEETGPATAELLVNLLAELEKYSEAIEVSRENLSDQSYELSCPSLIRLCHMARDYRQMKQIAKESGDYLTYVAASALEREGVGV